MRAYLEITCYRCGSVSKVTEDQIDMQQDYICPDCGVTMDRNQWRKEKIRYYAAEELLRQAEFILGVTESAHEIHLFDVVCRGVNGVVVPINATCQVTNINGNN